MNRQDADVRSLVGRRVSHATGQIQGLLQEIRRLRHQAASLDHDREGRQRLLLILGLLAAHGPREDRLLCYQLDEMDRHLRRHTGAGLTA